MIYQKGNMYFLKKGDMYEIASVEIKFNRIKKRNVIVVTGTGEYVSELENPIEWTFKDLEEELVG